MAQKTTITEFESVFPKLEAALVEQANSYKLPVQALEWYKKVSVSETRGGRRETGPKP